jgi:putative ABC transport system permease protein
VKYLHLLRVSLTRKIFRTLLTVGSFAVAMFLFGLLIVIHGAFNQGVEVAGVDRLFVINRVSIIQPLPFSYKDRIARIPGVKMVTFGVWFGGVYQDPKNFFPQFAVDTSNYNQMYGEFKIAPEQWKTFENDREGAIVGAGTAKRFNWKLGDRVPLKGTIYQGTWQFNIDGIYTGSRKADDVTQFWFHYDYLNESPAAGTRKDDVEWYIVKLENPDDAANVIKAIDGTFVNSPWETKTDTESAFAAGFVKQSGNIEFLIVAVGSIVFFTLLLVTGNTMAIAVRERTAELAIFKAIGFTDLFVLLYVIAESLCIALIGGTIGLLLAKGFTMLGDPTGGLLPLFYLPDRSMAIGVGVALLIGAIAGFLPALTASRLRVVDALRRV